MELGRAAIRLRVLVVDDDRDAAESTATLLSLSGFDARAATNGADALRMAGEVEPDVVLLDLKMPGMDGYAVADHLRERFPWRRPLLVALSGCAGSDDHRRSASAGFDLHLDKPVSPAVLVGVLRRFARVLSSAPSGPS